MNCIEADLPFALPERWVWARLASVSVKITDGTHKTPEKSMQFQGYYLLSARNIQNGFLSLEHVDYITKDIYQNITTHCGPTVNDVLLSCSGSVGRAAVITDSKKYALVRSVALIRPLFLSPYYLMHALQSEELQQQMQKVSKQTNQANLLRSNLLSLLVPVPPLSEQERIVKFIKDAWTLMEQMEYEQKCLQSAAKSLKAKILHCAFRGELLPSPSRERACSHRSAPLHTPIDRKEPHAIPEHWRWCRLNEIGGWQTGSTPSRQHSEYYGGAIPWVKSGDLQDDYITATSEYITQTALDDTAIKLVPADTVVIGMYGSAMGRLGITTSASATNQACCACCRPRDVNIKYLFYYLTSQKKAFLSMARGGNQPNLSKEQIMQTWIPVPPIGEQIQIVRAIERCFEHLYKIENYRKVQTLSLQPLEM